MSVMDISNLFSPEYISILSDEVYFDLSSAYSIDPQTSDVINTDGTHIIPYGEGDLEGEEPHHQWYRADISKPTDKSSN